MERTSKYWSFTIECGLLMRQSWLFFTNSPHNHPARLPTFRPTLIGLTIAIVGLGVLAGLSPVLLLTPLLLAVGAMLPLPPAQGLLAAGVASLLTGALLGSDVLLTHQAHFETRAIASAIWAALLGILLRTFILRIEWDLASRSVLATLTNADNAATPDSVIEQAIALLRDFALADAAFALRQLDDVTAEAFVCLPPKGAKGCAPLPNKLTTPKLFESALTDNRCRYYPDYASSPDAARILVAKGTQSLAILPLQPPFDPAVSKGDSSGVQGAILLIWYTRTDISLNLRRFIESVLGGLRTVLRFQHTTFSFDKLQARYSAILETIPQGVVFVDESGEHGWLNQTAADLLGLVPGDVEPLLISQAMAKLRMSAENREAIAVQGAQFFSQQGAEIRDWHWIFSGDDPTVLSISSTPTKVRDVPGRLWLLDDITIKYFGQVALKERTAQLEVVNQELESFSYSVSHDLRAPLRRIEGFSKMLVRDYADKLGGDGQTYIERIRYSTNRMSQLIEDLLALSRVTGCEIKREEIDMSAMAGAIAKELQKTQPERSVEFQIQAGVVANGDRRLLQIVLENLIGNAWKYTSQHDRASIEFGVIDASSGLETQELTPNLKSKVPNPKSNQSPSITPNPPIYFLRDDGAGFDMTYADKLFGAFQRLHVNSQFEGTGIGLATVQRIIHRHGGRIWAKAAVEQGATFYFTL